MERKPNGKTISLRYVVFKKDRKFYSICLETNIVTRANTTVQLREKIIDSTILYFESFTPEQLESKKYIRKAPFMYRLLWHIPKKNPVKKVEHNTGIFDSNSGMLKFA